MPELSHTVNLAPTVVYVDGLTRSGKSLLGPILSAFERVEIERMEPIVDWLGDAWHLGRIQRDAAVTLIRMAVDEYLYEGLIGRNTNFRFGDHTSVWHAPRPWRYLRRMLVDERLPIAERVVHERPVFQNMTHHQLMNLELHVEAFGPRLRVLEMIRDPVDLVDSWMRKQKGELLGQDPLINIVYIGWNGRDLPWYAAGWEDEYLACSPVERVVRLVATKWDLTMATWRALDDGARRQVLLMPLEDFIERAPDFVQVIADFIGVRPTRGIRRALKRAGCPRPYDREARVRRLDRLRRDMPPATSALLDRLVAEHAELMRRPAK